jgi:flagellar biosynthesis/type III secretory pathway protein FliH
VVIRLHPSDLELLNRRVQGKPPPWSAGTPLQFVPDTSLNRGDCRGEAQHITILSDVELQLSEIRRHLLENLSDASERRANPSGSGHVRRFPDRRETA